MTESLARIIIAGGGAISTIALVAGTGLVFGGGFYSVAGLAIIVGTIPLVVLLGVGSAVLRAADDAARQVELLEEIARVTRQYRRQVPVDRTRPRA
jgi:hypothetical protein